MEFEIPDIKTSIDGMDSNPYAEVMESMNDYAAATVYITNYMCKYMAPILAIYDSGNVTMSFQMAYDLQVKWLDTAVAEMNDRIQELSSEEMIRQKVEADDLKGLRDGIDAAKDACIEKMIAARNGEMTDYAGGASIGDYMLSETYADEIRDFIKIDENPYVEELQAALVRFKDSRRNESVMSESELKNACKNESAILKDIADRAIASYRGKHDMMSGASMFSSLRECSWKNMGTVYDSNVKCDYHVVSVSDDVSVSDGNNVKKASETPVEMGFPEETTTAQDPNTMAYWLRYLGVASLVNAMTPIYWSTGLIGPNGPVKLPVIMFPLYVIEGSMTVVLGLGICGIMPYPLILFVNFGSLPASIVIPVNIAVDVIRKTIKDFASKSKELIMADMSVELKAVNEKIKKTEDEISEISKQITDIKNIDISEAARQELERIKKERRLK